MADPVAARSGFLCTYMSGHPDTLVAYVRHFGGVTAPVVFASMTSIDTKGMSFTYVVKGTEAKEQVVVLFEPALSGYDEVKPRLLGMKLDAEEALGMARRPQITTFEVPRDIWITLTLELLLIYVTFSVPRPYSSLHNIGPWIRTVVGGTILRYIWVFTLLLHVAEALYIASLCKRHTTGLINGAKWTISVFIFGFPFFVRLRRLIQMARIDSITKIH